MPHPPPPVHMGWLKNMGYFVSSSHIQSSFFVLVILRSTLTKWHRLASNLSSSCLSLPKYSCMLPQLAQYPFLDTAVRCTVRGFKLEICSSSSLGQPRGHLPPLFPRATGPTKPHVSGLPLAIHTQGQNLRHWHMCVRKYLHGHLLLSWLNSQSWMTAEPRRCEWILWTLLSLAFHFTH